MTIVTKVHKKDNRTIIAVCDSTLLGTTLEEGSAVLDLTSDFYHGEERDDREVGDLIRNADMVNLVGKQAIQLGIDEGIIDAEHIKRVRGVPYAQAVIQHE